jgi:photosystem II stability/assembly factor-like uncharacterized protein
MKKVLLLIFVISAHLSCIKDKVSVNEFEGICNSKTEIFSPQGYTLKTIGNINFAGTVKSFQFVNDQTGFALLHNHEGGVVEIFKTTDGGMNWANLNIGINRTPRSMVFKDENFGFITVLEDPACILPDCISKCTILKTENGGLDWVQVEYEDLNGYLIHPKYDDKGNLFATFSMNGQSTILKSTDNALSWHTHFDSVSILPGLYFSFDFFEDKIYAKAGHGKILVIDSEGQLIKTMESGNSSIYEVEILDENNIIVTMFEKVVKTSDGGDTWQTIHDQGARMIGFDSPEKGLILMQKNSCQTDDYYVNDLFATSDNGGLNWKEAEKPTTRLRVRFTKSQKMGDGAWFIMLGSTLMELREN